MATELNPKPISCIAKAAIGGIKVTKHFMLHLVLDEEDSEMLDRARKRAVMLMTAGAAANQKVADLHVAFD